MSCVPVEPLSNSGSKESRGTYASRGTHLGTTRVWKLTYRCKNPWKPRSTQVNILRYGREGQRERSGLDRSYKKATLPGRWSSFAALSFHREHLAISCYRRERKNIVSSRVFWLVNRFKRGVNGETFHHEVVCSRSCPRADCCCVGR
jgi:hypothetical protein